MKLLLATCALLLSTFARAQTKIHGRIISASDGEPFSGASILNTVSNKHSTSGHGGEFLLEAGIGDSILCTATGFTPVRLSIADSSALFVLMYPKYSQLQMTIVTADRTLMKRTQAPIAISVISAQTIAETKAIRLDQLLNRVPGVFMVDLGNEQHSMAIRQPLGYSNLYLYMVDGIPIRTVGDFNHNALIEINQASLGSIEVVKGPASSLYGSEAVGGAVNFITRAPDSVLAGKLQTEVGSYGYKRSDLQVSNSFGKWGFFVGTYYAGQNQSVTDHNDFNKVAFTFRIDYHPNKNSVISSVTDIINYKTDQKGGLDSADFYARNYSSKYRFTYRQVNAVRTKISFDHRWNNDDKTLVNVFFRHSSIEQNPFYSIGDVAGNPLKARGQVNEDAFHSFGAIAQHSHVLKNWRAQWTNGVSIDYSPATYVANFISIDKNNAGIYYQFTNTDSLLTDYAVGLLNTAAYSQFDIKPARGVKLTATARYDRLDYRFDNHLPPGAYTGAPDTKNHFDHFTPKLGFTYNSRSGIGGYGNFSVGFAPPNITDLYTGVKVPVLKPATYNNYEIGAWIPFSNAHGYAQFSVYRMEGKNEIISVRLPDGTYANQNAGATLHRGFEWDIQYFIIPGLDISAGGTIVDHKYVDYADQGKNYAGNQMAQAPHNIMNITVAYRPSFFKGFFISSEWQHVGKYFTDAANTATYNGFDVLNVRTAYRWRQLELWVNCINVTNSTFATTVEKSAYGVSYRPGDLRRFNVGIAFYFGNKKKDVSNEKQ